MKKIYIIMIAVLIGLMYSNVSAQPFTSGFENWTVTAPITPTDWFGSKTSISSDSIFQYTSSVHGGTYAVQLKSSTTTHKRFTTQGTPIIAGKTYKIDFWVRGHGEIRTGCYKGAGSAGSTYYTYNNYILLDTLGWKHCSQTILVDTTSAVAQFILSVRNTRADKDYIQVDDVTIDTIATLPPANVSIHDIQYTTAVPAVSPYANQTVSTMGIVTGKCLTGYFIQDGTGEWNGIWVLDAVNTLTVNRGDSVRVTGLVYEDFNQTLLKNISAFEVLATGITEPAAADVTSVTVKDEKFEGVLVKISNAECTDANAGYGMWTVSTTGDLADTCKIHNLLYAFPSPVVGTNYDITGPVYFSYSEFRIEPRDINDVMLTGINENDETSFSIYPNPVSANLLINDIDGIEQINIVNLLGETVATYSVNGNYAGLNVADLQSGIYLVTLLKQNVIAGKAKFIKE
ncbi:MAG TPA: T9SS type A sorting domain-containing protein [Bacteroidales bacterium]|nr:T9SS type A sorting domain-containing protein [Bacteroidales bacterium]